MIMTIMMRMIMWIEDPFKRALTSVVGGFTYVVWDTRRTGQWLPFLRWDRRRLRRLNDSLQGRSARVAEPGFSAWSPGLLSLPHLSLHHPTAALLTVSEEFDPLFHGRTRYRSPGLI